MVTRLSESKKNKESCCNSNHTFSPKLNALSLKLAQERAVRQEEVEARAAELAAARLNEFYSEYTFRPKVSERSMKIAEGLGVGFLTRDVPSEEHATIVYSLHVSIHEHTKIPSTSDPSAEPTQQPAAAAGDSKGW